MKKIHELQEQYLKDYKDIPRDDEERLHYLINTLNLSDEYEDKVYDIDMMMEEQNLL